MTKLITAEFEKGVIKPKKPLALPEHQELQILVITSDIHSEAKKAVFDFDIDHYVTREDVKEWK